MKIGVPKEIKNQEYRVGMTPTSARELVLHGHDVVVQSDCGHAIGLKDSDYRTAGATVVEMAEDVFTAADLIVKVKEPLAQEMALLREG